MALARRILRLLGAALAFTSYVWYAAVRHAPEVKRRKAAKHPKSIRRPERV